MSHATRTPIGDSEMVKYLRRGVAFGDEVRIWSNGVIATPGAWLKIVGPSGQSSALIGADDAHEIIAALTMWLEDVGEGA